MIWSLEFGKTHRVCIHKKNNYRSYLFLYPPPLSSRYQRQRCAGRILLWDGPVAVIQQASRGADCGHRTPCSFYSRLLVGGVLCAGLRLGRLRKILRSKSARNHGSSALLLTLCMKLRLHAIGSRGGSRRSETKLVQTYPHMDRCGRSDQSAGDTPPRTKQSTGDEDYATTVTINHWPQ